MLLARGALSCENCRQGVLHELLEDLGDGGKEGMRSETVGVTREDVRDRLGVTRIGGTEEKCLEEAAPDGVVITLQHQLNHITNKSMGNAAPLLLGVLTLSIGVSTSGNGLNRDRCTCIVQTGEEVGSRDGVVGGAREGLSEHRRELGSGDG